MGALRLSLCGRSAQALALAAFDTHLPNALRLFRLVPYFAANASRPSVLRSAAQSFAALLRALIFLASASSAASFLALAV